MQIVIEDYNLNEMERRLCYGALLFSGNISKAAELLGISRHALKRRLARHQINWPGDTAALPSRDYVKR